MQMELSNVEKSILPRYTMLSSEHQIRYQIVKGSELPSEYLDLRRRVYVEETGFLTNENMFDANDRAAEHVLLYEGSNLIAGTVVAQGELTDLAEYTPFDKRDLKSVILSTRSIVSPEHRKSGYLTLLVYLALRHGRINDRNRYMGYVEPGKIPAWKILKYNSINGGVKREISDGKGQSYIVEPVEGGISEGCLRAFDKLPDQLKKVCNAQYFPEEIVKLVVKRAGNFYQHPFFDAVNLQVLTKSQYIQTLTNKHEFVRWTTRILGRAVGMCQEPAIRKHYVNHLTGEINHEKWLEEDLEYLGYDLDFLANHHVPDKGVLNFMFTQEALTSSRLDPIIFLAVPIAIEGASAFMSREFINNLQNCVKNWGYEKPHMATRFLASHLKTDGDEEVGHWIGTLDIIPKYLKSERQLQYMLNIINIVFDSLESAYSEYTCYTKRERDVASIG
jgi:hypothetical protein